MSDGSGSVRCVVCGQETRQPPYRIECDASGRARVHLQEQQPPEPPSGQLTCEHCGGVPDSWVTVAPGHNVCADVYACKRRQRPAQAVVGGPPQGTKEYLEGFRDGYDDGLAHRSDYAVPDGEHVQCRIRRLSDDLAEIKIGGAGFDFPGYRWAEASRFVEHVEKLVNRPRSETAEVSPTMNTKKHG